MIRRGSRGCGPIGAAMAGAGATDMGCGAAASTRRFASTDAASTGRIGMSATLVNLAVAAWAVTDTGSGVAMPKSRPPGPSAATSWPNGSSIRIGGCRLGSVLAKASEGVAVRIGGSSSIAGASRHAGSRTGAAGSCRAGAGLGRVFRHNRTNISRGLLGARVQPPDLADELLAETVFHVEDLVQGPVEVVGDVRDLFEQGVGRVRHEPPGTSPATSTTNSCSHSGQETVAFV
jgi:hypothetical protein